METYTARNEKVSNATLLSTDTEQNDAGDTESVTDSEQSRPEMSDIDALMLEESRMEDGDALAQLIKDKLSGDSADTEVVEETTMQAPASEAEFEDISLGESVAPPARKNTALSSSQCYARLRKAGVSYEKPDFGTPHVDAPVLLTDAISGVWIRPRWESKSRLKAVMDCHLVLALTELARVAQNLGVIEINFYSTYRPLKAPPKRCPKGKRRKRCLKQRKKYRNALKSSSPSEHRFARAIDIRYFKMADGREIDVLEHFERRSGKDPCGYRAKTEEGQVLSRFVCELYQNRVFNVMLTPNANKAHHNHFHFDLSPRARWYILR